MTIRMRAALLAGALAVTAGIARAESVTLQDAIARGVAAAPVLRAADAAVDAAQAGRRQADVRPNPTLSVEAENFAGTGGAIDQAQITAAYNQLVERGGKRQARVVLAEREIAVAEASRTVARLDLIAAIQRAFIDVLIADRVAEASAARLVTERALQREAVRRVRGYKDPLFVETRAAARVADAEIAADLAQVRRRSTRAALAAFWGGSGDGLEPGGALGMTALAGDANTAALSSADAALGDAAIARAGAAAVVEQTRAKQDYTWSGGVRVLPHTRDVALVAGIAIPLGRFDRNRGNIERAQAEHRRAGFAAAAAVQDRTRRLATLRAEADSALTRSDRIMAEVLPRARRALTQVREGYNRGGFTFRDIQDAADAIIAINADLVTAMTAYRDVQSEIDRLTGRFDAPQPLGATP
ncbi:MAG: TolC family protein [Pseudomonadota bacterium]